MSDTITYDYIITGAGAAGLSLVCQMMQYKELQQKRILIIDKEQKNTNDRTWCFWEKENGLFEKIVFKQWQHLNFYSEDFYEALNIHPYKYKMIRSSDFYNEAISIIRNFKNIEWITEEIIEVNSNQNNAEVKTLNGVYKAQLVFNSILKKIPQQKNRIYFLQHFKGYFLETAFPVFDVDKATLMDFRIDQKNDTRFVYVLPFDGHHALVEYTVFSEILLPENEYDVELKNYINTYLNCNEYKIQEEEFGVIPMTNANFNRIDGNIINIGTAGGMTKASTGFTFQFIQQQTKIIAEQLAANGKINELEITEPKRFAFYDSVLLNILQNRSAMGKEIFKRMFKFNEASTVLSFLENKTSINQELKMFSKLPIGPFTNAAIKELFSL